MSRAAPGLVLLLMFAGCAKDEDYLEVMREQRTAWQEMAEILESVKDEKTMADAKKALDERSEKYAAISRKAKALPNPPPAEVIKRMEEDKAAVKFAIDRLTRAAAEVRKLPGGPEFMKHFESTAPGLMSAVRS